MVVSADSVLNNINRVFDDSTKNNLRASVSNFNETITDLKTTSSLIKNIVETNQSEIDASLKNIKSFTGDFSEISAKLNDAEIDETFKNFKIFV